MNNMSFKRKGEELCQKEDEDDINLKEDWLLVATVRALYGHLWDCVSVLDLPDGLVLGRDLIILLTPAVVILTSCNIIIIIIIQGLLCLFSPVLALLQLLAVKSWPILSSDLNLRNDKQFPFLQILWHLNSPHVSQVVGDNFSRDRGDSQAWNCHHLKVKRKWVSRMLRHPFYFRKSQLSQNPLTESI